MEAFSKFTVSLTFRLAFSRYDVSFTQKRKKVLKISLFRLPKARLKCFGRRIFLMVHFQKTQFETP